MHKQTDIFFICLLNMLFNMFCVCIFAHVCRPDCLLKVPLAAEQSMFEIPICHGIWAYVLWGHGYIFNPRDSTASIISGGSGALIERHQLFLSDLQAKLSLPTRRATAPAPPEGRAGPASYTASSDATTMANLPSQALDSIQLTQLYTPAVAP